MTATAVQTRTAKHRGVRGVSPRLTAYTGPLWVIQKAVVGRDDRSNQLVCTCSTYHRNSRCRHVASVVLTHRRNAVYQLPTGAEELRVTFVWLAKLMGLEQPAQRLHGYSVTLKRIKSS